MTTSLKNKKILVTCGPTWVPIDKVRIISNISSGQLGQMIAQKLDREGARVTLLEGPVANPLKNSRIQIKKFSFYDELRKLIHDEVRKNYDVVIHLAAVSDYKLRKAFQGKLNSSLKKLTLELVPTKKLINEITVLNRNAFLVGFKLLPKLSKGYAVREAKGLMNKAHCDLVVANSLSRNKYSAFVVSKTGCSNLINSREDLTKILINNLKQNL